MTGLFYGDAGQLLAQLIGAATIVVVMGGIAYGFFTIQNKLTKGGIRPPEEEELIGLDRPELGVLAYPDFEPVAIVVAGNGSGADGHDDGRAAEPVTVTAASPD